MKFLQASINYYGKERLFYIKYNQSELGSSKGLKNYWVNFESIEYLIDAKDSRFQSFKLEIIL